MGSWNNCKKNVVPFAAIAAVECSIVATTTLYKAAHAKGLHYFVFFTYSYILASLVLLFLSFVFPRRRLPPFKLSVLNKIILLSVIGLLAMMSGYKGIEYSSPALASSISTLAPAFTFILALLFRMESLDLRSSTTQAKIIGTIASISGALVAVLCKGPTILSSQSPKVSYHSLGTSQANWAIGGLLQAIAQLLSAASHILQAHILIMYPAELYVAVMHSLGLTIIAIPVSFMVENQLSAWTLKPDIKLAIVMYAGLFGKAFILAIYSFCLPLKGPLYISIFKPLSIIIATAASFILLGDDLHLGSVVGGMILLLGFYAVLWGKAKEQETKNCGSESLGASIEAKIPLLRSHIEEKCVE
ncbi:Plant-drug/metabolite exporter [Parasponia andersonii]|uniref:WAT1-related protein n=1 Tax=Parasponia andersonii TaxID=3476 RepID=A0A2P5BF76_PARAD|nr:Plant-drug/metabolite exporter [Parasponia andersonii]